MFLIILQSPFNSVPSSPMSEAYLLPESTVADLAEVSLQNYKKSQEGVAIKSQCVHMHH